MTEVVGWPIPSQVSCCTKACLFVHAPRSVQLTSCAIQHMPPRMHCLLSPCRKCDFPAMALMQACCRLNLMRLRISSHLLITFTISLGQPCVAAAWQAPAHVTTPAALNRPWHALSRKFSLWRSRHGNMCSVSSSISGAQRKTPGVGSNDECAAMVLSCYCMNDP